VLFSEGVPATSSSLSTGAWVGVQGAGGDGEATASTVTLLSVSRTGAQFGLTRSTDGKTVRITGRGWPAGKEISFTLKASDDAASKPFATSQADSRGNLNFVANWPQSDRAQNHPLWVFGVVSENGATMTQVVLPYDTVTGDPPGLVVLSRMGEQQGGVGSYCWEGKCVDKVGVPLSSIPLRVTRSEILGLRSQYGPDPHLGLLPTRFTAQLYLYPSDPASQGVSVNGVYYFAPRTSPSHNIEVPGRPFSVSLPSNLRAGIYALLIFAEWVGPSGRTGDSIYGFLISVP
jgi:hypothetical protein